MCVSNLREPLLINMVHHNNLIVVAGRRTPGAIERQTRRKSKEEEDVRSSGKHNSRRQSVPETARARPNIRRPPSIIIGDALCAAEMFGQKVQLVQRGLKGQLMQPLLRRAGRLMNKNTATIYCILFIHRLGTLSFVTQSTKH